MEASPVDAQAQARLRARRRLIGAAALVLVGVIVFPLLFETQPRPIPAEVALVINGTEARVSVGPSGLPDAPGGAPQAAVPGSLPSEEAAAGPVDSASSPAPAASGGSSRPRPEAHSPPAQTEGGGTQGRPAPSDRVAAGWAESEPAGQARPAPPAEMPKTAKRDQERAIALLEGRNATESAPVAPVRYVVQIGAFSDVALAAQVRQKVERAGMKTYTHVIESSSGKRIRVRVGPMGQRDEAERVLAKLKSLGLAGSILTL